MTTEKEAAPASRPWDDLRRIADEVRLKLHLAGMEARDRWHSLEPRLVELEHKIERGGEKAADVVNDQLTALTDALRRFADDLREDLAIGKKKKDGEAAAEASPAEAPASEASPGEATQAEPARADDPPTS